MVRRIIQFVLASVACLGSASAEVGTPGASSLTDAPAGCPPLEAVGLGQFPVMLRQIPDEAMRRQVATGFTMAATGAHINLRRFDCALIYADRGVAFAPADPMAQMPRISALQALRRFDDMLAAAHRMHELAAAMPPPAYPGQPDAQFFHPEAFAAEATALNEMGRHAEAQQVMAKAVEGATNPMTKQIMEARRALLHVKAGAYEAALAACDALETEAMVLCAMVRAEAHFGKREYDAAVLLYDEILRGFQERRQIMPAHAAQQFAVADRGNLFIYVGACRAKIFLGLLDVAAHDCTRAVEVAPDDPYAQFASSELARARGDVSGADAALARARAAEPEIDQFCGNARPCP